MSAVEPSVAIAPRRRGLRSRSLRHNRAGPVTYAVLIVTAILSLLPLYWTVVAASRSNADIAKTPPPFTPGGNLISNIRKALDQVDMWQALLNSLIVSTSIALGTVFFCTLAGFAFAKLKFRGSSVLLVIVLATMMVPAQLGVIPLFMLIAKLHWVNHLQAVILPTLVSAFGVVFMRQYLINALPNELLEAAVIDGASSFTIFRKVVIPAARPAMAVLGMLTFLMAWNDFFWPIIALTTQNPTVQVALNSLGNGYVPDHSVILAGTLVGTVPVLIVFALLGKQIVGGIMEGAVKG
ncbi:MAG TPA: carbohydrate ABC transporter permease [Gaiellaceae bacterium]